MGLVDDEYRRYLEAMQPAWFYRWALWDVKRQGAYYPLWEARLCSRILRLLRRDRCS